MYWIDKCKDEIDLLFKMDFSITLIGVGIWCLNGGINDWGVVHHIVIYIMLTNFASIILIAISILIMALHDITVWLLK